MKYKQSKPRRAPSGIDPATRGTPQYPDLERVFLSAILRKPSIFPQVEAMLNPGHFGVEFYGEIWMAFCLLHSNKDMIDPVSLSSHLISEGVLKPGENDGERYIAPQIVELQQVAYTTEFDYMAYAKRIKKMSAIREIQSRCMGAIDECFEKDEPEVIRTELIKDLLGINTTSTDQMYDMTDVDALFEQRINESDEDKVSRVIDTGFKTLDRAIEGIKECSINSILAYQKHGKSTMGTQWVMYEACKTQNASLVFMLEMDRLGLYTRLIQQQTGIKMNHIMSGRHKPTAEEWQKIKAAQAYLRGRNVHIVDCDCRNLQAIRAYVHQFIAKNPHKRLGWVMIDHWNLLDTSHGRNEVGGQEKNAADLSDLAKETRCRILLPAQCRKPNAGDEDKPPSRHDVRGSSALLDIVDNLITLHRPNMGNGATGATEQVQVTLEAGRYSAACSSKSIGMEYDPKTLAFYDNDSYSFWGTHKIRTHQTVLGIQ